MYSELVLASLSDPMVKLAAKASIPPLEIHTALRNALVNKTEFVEEVLVLHRGNEQRLYAAFAAQSNLGFIADIEPQNLIVDSSAQNTPVSSLPFISYRAGFAESQLLIAPTAGQLRQLLGEKLPENLFPRLRIVTPTALKEALEIHFRAQRVQFAVHNYANQHPEHSSQVTLQGWQGWFFGFLFGAGPALFLLFPGTTLLVLHVFAWLFFFSCVVLRLAAALTLSPPNALQNLPDEMQPLPTYAILV
ncbi:MAG: hypothetical protein ACRCT6_00280, partial [Notoacmeibacter sp.]